jgi:hypothetical protein
LGAIAFDDGKTDLGLAINLRKKPIELVRLNTVRKTDEDTLTFAINLDNSLRYDPNFIGPKTGQSGTYTGKASDSKWRNSIIKIRDLESLTGYNFFSNIPTDIQNAIENQDIADVLTKINGIDSEPLMAATDEALTSTVEVGFPFNSSIRHDSIPNKITFTTDQVISKSRVFEIGTSQNAVSKERTDGFGEIGISSINTFQSGSSKISFPTIGTGQVGEIQISIPQISFPQTTTKEVSPSQISLSQSGSFKTNILQISSTQVNTREIGTFQPWNIDNVTSIQTIGFQDINPSKISLPVSVPSQQFVGSNFPNQDQTSNCLTQLQSTLVTNWHLPTDLTLTFDITNLLPRQLAEAQITNYDSFGRPSGGTILIDSDANGKGWFIDSTPSDKSEFTNNLNRALTK